MANFFSYVDYIDGIRRSVKQTNPCGKRDTLNWTLCDITGEPKEDTKPYDSEHIIVKEYGAGALGQFLSKARDFCLGFEVWTAEFTVKEQGEKYLLTQGNCTADASNFGYGTNRTGRSCSKTTRELKWGSWTKKSPETWRGNPELNLRVCMDIVQMIIYSFGINGVENGAPKFLRREDGCGELSRMLAEWSNESLRDRIMGEWFSNNNKGSWSYQNYILSGIDFFEFLQELIVGNDKADKSIGCRKATPSELRNGACRHGWCPEELASVPIPVENSGRGVSQVGGETDLQKSLHQPTGAHTEPFRAQDSGGSGEAGVDATLRHLMDEGTQPANGGGSPVKRGADGMETSEGSSGLGGLIGGVFSSLILGMIAVYGISRILRRGGRRSKKWREEGENPRNMFVSLTTK
ncbi:hypothetical protein C922_05259 [Plasmodium inui San Antonio 1]|uniref:Uncharacterized protein n=1 Tax=Plasmodium inui San Antonio 1 TaxID=1237626 RepID=W7AGB7_9APIC|nr:hypothetical protein C922_05259 [Plasmodium inui San Antonio 1]EUD64356.1 hypothetical protein C922_05259 [Plasmodium inui San Antonio 1]